MKERLGARVCSSPVGQRMGTKILQRRLPDWKVIRCERIEDAVLWEKYTAKRAQPLGVVHAMP